MKNRILAANWKSNMTKNEAKNWLEEFSKTILPAELEVILFVPFTLLDFVSSYISDKDISVRVGAQDVSRFDQGAYTGEINARQVKEFGDYVLIGHSERRENFDENQSVIKTKIEKAQSQGLIPMICISNFDQARELEEAQNAIFAFEPLSAIGSGNAEDPSSVLDFSQKFGATFENQLIYGGSVNARNVKNYLNIENISGVLVGSESLSPQNFSELITNAV